MSTTSHIIAAGAVPIIAVAGSKIGVLAQAAAGHDLPGWISGILGPAGALVATLLAIRWLVGRLDKSEAKAEVRDQERMRNFETLVSLTEQGQRIIEQNSEVLKEVKTAIRKQ